MTGYKPKSSMDGAFYIHPGADPLFNMGFDNWIFKQLQTESGFPKAILRLYSWKRPAVTVGYNQKIEQVIDWRKLDESIPVIRRITGGRAIYHDDSEITFTLAADLDIFAEDFRSLSQTNSLISKTMVEILAKIGVISEWSRKSDSTFKKMNGNMSKSCFNSFSKYEILSDSNKIIAGAQRRKGRYFIHQGSIKINGVGNCPAIGQFEPFESKLTGQQSRNSYKYTIDDLTDSFQLIFSERLGIKFAIDELSEKLHRRIFEFAENCCPKIT